MTPDPRLAIALLLLAAGFGLLAAVACRRALAASARRCRRWYAEAAADEPAAVLGGPWSVPEARPAWGGSNRLAARIGERAALNAERN